MHAGLREQVWNRAAGRCEYCHVPHELDLLPFQVDHIRPIKHGGRTVLENLALSCLPCNAHKGPNLAGIDPETGSVAALFDPRRKSWAEHFQWDGPRLVGLTASARATITVLAINAPRRVAHRRLLLAAGNFPG